MRIGLTVPRLAANGADLSSPDTQGLAADRAYLLRDGVRIGERRVGNVLNRAPLAALHGAPEERIADAAASLSALLPG